jgi:hypothetical protein
MFVQQLVVVVVPAFRVANRRVKLFTDGIEASLHSGHQSIEPCLESVEAPVNRVEAVVDCREALADVIETLVDGIETSGSSAAPAT